MKGNSHTEVIGQLNDLFRSTLQGGRVMLTPGVMALPEVTQRLALGCLKGFDDFNDDNDPYGEHDFGSFQIKHYKFFWKIDYLDEKMGHGSTDPSDSNKTTRVLTLMLAEEY